MGASWKKVAGIALLSLSCAGWAGPAHASRLSGLKRRWVRYSAGGQKTRYTTELEKWGKRLDDNRERARDLPGEITKATEAIARAEKHLESVKQKLGETRNDETLRQDLLTAEERLAAAEKQLSVLSGEQRNIDFYRKQIADYERAIARAEKRLAAVDTHSGSSPSQGSNPPKTKN
jgi:chromosome segregation ATPase